MSTPAVTREAETEAAGSFGMGLPGCASAAAGLRVAGAWTFAAAAAAGKMRKGWQSCTAGLQMSVAAAVAVGVPWQQHRHQAAC